MRRNGFHRWDRAALVIGVLGILALTPNPAGAQDPVIIPGLPGAGLQAGERPAPTAWPYSDLPGGKAATPTDATDTPPAAPPFGLTGNWFGARDALFDEGIDLRTNLSQFYQGVTGGGLRQGFRYGLKFDYFGTVEAEKLFGWEGLFVNLHGESRFGQSVNRDVGALLPANFAMEFPQPTGSASALTNVQIEQFLSPDLVVTFGKLNAADGVNIHPFLGGNGIDRFLNEAFVLSPIYGRTIPYSTPGAGFSYLRDLDPVFTFLVLDSSGRPDTSGLSRMFSNGASLFAHLRVPVTPFGLPGHQSLEGAYTSGKFSPLSEDDYVILPGIPANRRTGSWVLTYGFDQFLVVDAEDPEQGLGDLREPQPRRPGHQPDPLVPEPRGRRHQPAARPLRGLLRRGLLLPGDQQRPPGDAPAGLPGPQRAGLRTLLQRSHHPLVHPDGRHPGDRPGSTRRPVGLPLWSEGEDRFLANDGAS